MRRTLAVGVLVTLAVGCQRSAKAPADNGMAGMETGTTSTTGRGAVRLSAAQAQAIGVAYATVQRGALNRAIRTVGQVVPSEVRVTDITPKIDGFVDRVYVDQTGMEVHRGDRLLSIYSPMLVTAQQELLTARRLVQSVDSTQTEAWRNANALLDAARQRLGYWDISTDQIDHLERTGEVQKTMSLDAPFDGVVMEKLVVAGQSVMAGAKLYRLADLSTVWVQGDVYENDLSLIQMGAAARIEVAGYPGRTFNGRVTFVSPMVDPESRAGRVRVELPNPDDLLKPGMFATMFFDAHLGGDALSVPVDAVVMTGERNLVFVVSPDGALEPHDVTLGVRAGDRREILGGLTEGQRIVASANFLLDAESQLGQGAGMANMPGMDMGPPK
ncbi:MAG TPA: efflux RND transporter periplasmic adaptor subunit [Gemmatimonadales bacterium]|nr:efflux RND transporter periplasmic adaptor subunit [Gemmatimonadales bacterium]